MSDRHRGGPLRQETGRLGSEESFARTPSQRVIVDYSTPNVHRCTVVTPRRTRHRVHLGALLTFMTIVLAGLYLIAHVAASLWGWQNAAMVMTAATWILVMVACLLDHEYRV